MLGITVRGVGGRQYVGLLRTGRHAGRRAGSLHIDQHRGNLGEIGQPQKLAHQRQARAAGSGKCARTVPRCTHHHADRGEFVLCLHDSVILLAGPGVDAQAPAIPVEGIDHGGRGGDRVPGRNRRTAVYRTECRGGIAIHQYVVGLENVLGNIATTLHTQSDRAAEMLDSILMTEFQRVDIWRDQLFLALELIGNQVLENAEIDIEQGRQRTDIDHVLEQQTLARIAVFTQADLGERNADVIEIVTDEAHVERLGRIVDKIATRLDFAHIALHALGIDAQHQIDAPPPSEVALVADPHLEPGRQALDIRGKDIARADRDAHAKYRLCEHVVRTCRASAIDIGKLDYEIVYRFSGVHACPALVTL